MSLISPSKDGTIDLLETGVTFELSYHLVDEKSCDTVLSFMQEYYELDGYRFDPESAQAALLGIVRDASLGRAWLIFDGDEAVGYIVLTFGYSLEYGGQDATLDEVFISPIHRGKGVGTRVMEFVVGVCRDIGVYALHLEVERNNAAALALYDKAGFDIVDRCLMTKRVS
jgi:GNAT superfamily N-acetyltransferase